MKGSWFVKRLGWEGFGYRNNFQKYIKERKRKILKATRKKKIVKNNNKETKTKNQKLKFLQGLMKAKMTGLVN